MRNVAKFLSRICSEESLLVDRCVVSAFIHVNKVNIVYNKLLLSYLIDENDSDDILKIYRSFYQKIEQREQGFGIEDVIELFEFVISPSDRVVNGAIYTPADIRNFIVDQVLAGRSKLKHITVADISCGCSGFLYTAAMILRRQTKSSFQHIYENQIFGIDIQEYSVLRSKILLSLYAVLEKEDREEFKFKIYQGNTLSFEWKRFIDKFKGFDVIVGNPPYVCARNLDDNIKQSLQQWDVCKSGNPDLYIPFFQIGYESLLKNGILGFITMNSFFKSLNGRALRRYFKDKKTSVRVIDFGCTQIFRTKSTYTCICFLEKKERSYIEYIKDEKKESLKNSIIFNKIEYSKLDSKQGWSLDNNEVISQIESIGKPLGDIYRSRHGIATLRNDIYIFKPVYEDDIFFYLEKDGIIHKIEKNICRDIFNSNKLSREVNLEVVKEKIIFPYTNAQKPKSFDDLYFKETYPHAYRYLLKYKNELAARDKGKGKYEQWFSYGRTQSLERVTSKLFFPKFSDRIPSYIISNDENLLFYNGQAIIGHTEEEMLFIKKIMESRLFWFYIKSTSKPYSSGYYSLNGTYIKNFGIPSFSDADRRFILEEDNPDILNDLIENYYSIKIDKDFKY